MIFCANHIIQHNYTNLTHSHLICGDKTWRQFITRYGLNLSSIIFINKLHKGGTGGKKSMVHYTDIIIILDILAEDESTSICTWTRYRHNVYQYVCNKLEVSPKFDKSKYSFLPQQFLIRSQLNLLRAKLLADHISCTMYSVHNEQTVMQFFAPFFQPFRLCKKHISQYQPIVN